MKLAEFQKIASILGKEYKITIREGTRWAANVEKKIVYYRREDVYSLPEDHILGFLLHETAHIHYTTDVKMPDVNPELTHSTFNMLEDIAIENIISGDYPNAGEILASTQVEVLDTLMRVLPTIRQSKFEKSLLYAAARFEGRGYPTPILEYEKLGEEISKMMLAEENQILNRAKSADLMPLTEKIVAFLISKLGQPSDSDKKSMAEEDPELGESKGQQKVKGEIIQKLKDGNNQGFGMNIQFGKENIDYVDEIVEKAGMLGKKLRAVMKRNNATEFAGRFRSGKLLTKRLAKIVISKDRHPFAQRIIKGNKSYAFAVTCDVSGSMFGGSGKGSPISCAMSSMLMFAEALKVADISRAISIFADYSVTINDTNKKQVTWADINNTKHLDQAGGGTNIARAIDHCKKQLERSKAENKIMIIVTDGDANYQAMETSYKAAQKAGITCLGITIGGGPSSAMSVLLKENNRIIKENEISTIGDAFIDILKKEVVIG